jgi:hypothetical protein
MIAEISSGHGDLSDVLFLVAFILFVLEAVVIVIARPAIGRGILIAAGLACLALAWLVL